MRFSVLSVQLARAQLGIVPLVMRRWPAFDWRSRLALAVAGEGGSADPSAGLSAEADFPYTEPAFTGRLGKTLADSSPAYPERPVLSDQPAGSC